MDFQWLKTQLMLHPQKTKAELARALGLEPPAVSKILNGTRQIKASEYVAMRRFFGMPVDGASSLQKQAHSYTLLPLDAGGSLAEERDPLLSEWVIPANILSARTQAPPDQIRIFQVRENIMEPDFRQGEHVLVDLSDTHPSPPGVFVVTDGFGQMLRQCEFIPRSNPPEIRISASTSGFQAQTLTSEDFEIVGRVIAKLQML